MRTINERVAEDDLLQQLKDAEKKAEENWELLLRTKAEMENLRKRTEREIADTRKYAVSKFAADVLGEGVPGMSLADTRTYLEFVADQARLYVGDSDEPALYVKDCKLGSDGGSIGVRSPADGSAYFEVPADRNLFLQALDKDFRELQRERTYVNYRPGEVRSCTGWLMPRWPKRSL